jgi:bifunctional DNA-binding transcriptional regulator/antitoxin component of YhaV-PrlF toxin-antitoxin module
MNEDLRHVTKTFLSGKLSATLIIPIEIARRHGLEKPAHVVVEETAKGILIRRLEVENNSENMLLKPAKVGGQSLVRATVSNTSSGVDDAPQ